MEEIKRIMIANGVTPLLRGPMKAANEPYVDEKKSTQKKP